MNKMLCMLSCIALAMLLNCTLQPLAGGSSQQGNGIIIGSVTYAGSGLPVSRGMVRLRPAGFLKYHNGYPVQLPAARFRNLFTDEYGRFTVMNVDTGSYRVEVTDDKENGANAVLLECRITPIDSIAVIPAALLRPTGSIHGSYASIPDRALSVHLQIYGLDHAARIDTASKTFCFDEIPSGRYSAAIDAPTRGTSDVAALGTITVSPGAGFECGTIDLVALSAWRYSRRLYLNTTPSGADVSGMVTNFPLLVRLSDAAFDFSSAQSGGSDIRFAKSDGSPLAYEIERWDAVGHEAEIWVKTDTVYGNDNTHFITLHWGNPGVSGTSNSAAVFDTAAGFQGVWHMGQNNAAPANDATANRYDGTPSDTAPAPAPGAIGTAQEFNGLSNYLLMRGTANGRLNFPQKGRYSVSAWIYSDTLDDNWHIIVGKGHEQFHLKQQVLSRYGNWEFVEYQDLPEWQITETPVVSRTWKYLTGVRDNDKQYLYLDGVRADSVISRNPGVLPRNTDYDVSIGGYPYYVTYTNEGYCRFKGKIDEVRIASVACSADWIKLSFMNQRTDERLILFR